MDLVLLMKLLESTSVTKSITIDVRPKSSDVNCIVTIFLVCLRVIIVITSLIFIVSIKLKERLSPSF